MALDLRIPSQDVTVINGRGNELNNYYIEWAPYQPQKSYEVLYKIVQTDLYTSWRTCGVVQSTDTRFPIKTISDLVDYDFYEVVVKVKVTYQGTTDLGAITGEEMSDPKSLIFTHGIKNTLRVYDGYGTLEYPVYDEVSKDTDMQEMNISLNATGSSKTKLALVNQYNIVSDQSFNILTNKGNYNNYRYMHPAKSYANYSSLAYFKSMNEYGYSNFTATETYLSPVYGYTYQSAYTYGYGKGINTYYYISTSNYGSFKGIYNYSYDSKAIDIMQYTTYAINLPDAIQQYRISVSDVFLYSYSYDAPALTGILYYTVQVQTSAGEDDLMLRSGGHFDTYLSNSTSGSILYLQQSVAHYKTYSEPATYGTTSYTKYTSHKFISYESSQNRYAYTSYQNIGFAYGSYNVKDTSFKDAYYIYNYTYKGTSNKDHYLTKESGYNKKIYDGLVATYSGSIKQYTPTYKYSYIFNGSTSYKYKEQFSNYRYLYNNYYIKYNAAYDSYRTVNYLYYYYYGKNIEDWKYNIYYTESYWNEPFNVYFEYIATYRYVTTIDYTYIQTLLSYYPMYVYQVEFVNGGEYRYIHYYWPANGYRIGSNYDWRVEYYYYTVHQSIRGTVYTDSYNTKVLTYMTEVRTEPGQKVQYYVYSEAEALNNYTTYYYQGAGQGIGYTYYNDNKQMAIPNYNTSTYKYLAYVQENGLVEMFNYCLK